MDLDIFSIRCFVAVAENGSFTVAAQQINRTQSAISQQISKLEQQVGKPLINRGKKFSLTADGEAFLGYAKRIVQLQCDLLDTLQEPELQGVIRFGLPEDFATMLLTEVLVHFTQIHPRVTLEIECDLTINLMRRYKKREFDLVLVKMNRSEDMPGEADVWSEKLNWFGPTALVEPNKTIPLVLSPKPCVYRASALQALEQANLNYKIVFSSHSHAGKIAAVRAGLGISVLPNLMIPSDIAIIQNHKHLPQLKDTHVSLLKKNNKNVAINTLEKLICEKLQHKNITPHA